mgnify:CR=1 FL=1
MSDEQRAYPAVKPVTLTGEEAFTGMTSRRATVLNYWRWANSDLVGNVSRGILAEYLVALAVQATDEPRDPWAAFDVVTPSGITIEVKSAAYIQAWDQRALSRISFLTRATEDPILTPGVTPVVSRRSQVWVFALLHHSEQETLNPLDVSQWTFWVVPTPWLNARERSQHSITLTSLKASPYGVPVDFDHLAEAIAQVAAI